MLDNPFLPKDHLPITILLGSDYFLFRRVHTNFLVPLIYAYFRVRCPYYITHIFASVVT